MLVRATGGELKRGERGRGGVCRGRELTGWGGSGRLLIDVLEVLQLLKKSHSQMPLYHRADMIPCHDPAFLFPSFQPSLLRPGLTGLLLFHLSLKL